MLAPGGSIPHINNFNMWKQYSHLLTCVHYVILLTRKYNACLVIVVKQEPFFEICNIYVFCSFDTLSRNKKGVP